jgi:hypothetical protein
MRPGCRLLSKSTAAYGLAFFHREIGSTVSHSLEDVINSSDAQQFRSTLNVADDPTCRRCVCSLNYKKPIWTENTQARFGTLGQKALGTTLSLGSSIDSIS